MADDADQKLRDNAAAPRRVRIDGNEAEQHSLKDQIAHDKYDRSKQALAKGKTGLRFFKLIPPGSV